MIIQVKREKAINGSIPSKIYTDGDFFAYGLENEEYKIPAGKYNLSSNYSNKFGSNKLFIDVPGRTAIEFHGGNTKDDSKGCILVAAVRNGEAIAGDKSNDLYRAVDTAANAGEGVAVVVSDPFPWLKVAICAAAGGYIVYRLYRRKKRKTER